MNAQHPPGRPSPVFILGCQRSGTTLLQEILATARSVAMFHEGDPRAMTADHRLLPQAGVQAAIAAAWPQRSVFKPLCDSQFADRILAEHPTARAIWIYRRYQDVAGSLLRTWPGGQRGGISSLRYRRLQEAGWLGERVSQEALDHLELLWHEDLSEFECGCLMWCLRNYLYFEQGLDRMPDRVLLLDYQDMVLDAERVMPRVFDWVGASYDESAIARILTWNIGKDPPPPIAPPIAALCDRLLARLEANRWRPSIAGQPSGSRA